MCRGLDQTPWPWLIAINGTWTGWVGFFWWAFCGFVSRHNFSVLKYCSTSVVLISHCFVLLTMKDIFLSMNIENCNCLKIYYDYHNVLKKKPAVLENAIVPLISSDLFVVSYLQERALEWKSKTVWRIHNQLLLFLISSQTPSRQIAFWIRVSQNNNKQQLLLYKS